MTTKAKKIEDPNLYDGAAQQRIPLEVGEGSELYATAHIVGPVSDTLFLEFIDAVDTTIAEAEDLEQAIRDATVDLWRKIVKSVENIEVGQGEDYRDLIQSTEALAVMNSILNVGIQRATQVSSNVRNLSAKATVSVISESLFNGKLMTQTHTLARKTDEHRKKYDRIYSRFDKSEIKPSQATKQKGELYDEIAVGQTGFKGKVPLRFKAEVIDHYFRQTISPKK